MEVFKEIDQFGHEQVAFCYDKVSGLKSIIAIHNTTLGPALGGCRMWPYKSEEEALNDALRLSRGMTYKNAVMGLDLGGGKAVIIGDSRKDKSEELFRAFGKFVQSLGGRYITAEDVGISTRDMSIVASETEHVAGLLETSGDPSPATAYGVYRGMKACCKVVYGDDSLKGRSVAVQGVGHVGRSLVRYLLEEGASVSITDIYEDTLRSVSEEFKVQAVKPDSIYDVDCDIFSPCALGAVVNDDTLKRFKCKIIAGSANNQLKEPRHGTLLEERGIIYAPDYVINGGGVTNVADEFKTGGYNKERSYAQISRIYDKLLKVFEIARSRGIPAHEAADLLAEERISNLGRINRLYLAR